MGHDLVVLGDLVADLVVPDRAPAAAAGQPRLGGRHLCRTGGRGQRPGRGAAAGTGDRGAGARRTGSLWRRPAGMLDGGRRRHQRNRGLRRPRHRAVHRTFRRARAARLPRDQGCDRGSGRFLQRWHAVIRNARALYSDGYTLRDILAPDDVLAAFATARAAGVPTFFDPGPSIEFIPRPIMERAIAPADVLLLDRCRKRHARVGNLGDEEMADSLLGAGRRRRWC